MKQSYPFKTKFLQPCEAQRKKYALTENSRLITSDGTVIKDMVDGSVEVWGITNILNAITNILSRLL